jgi:Fe-S cluster biogenesis protein NfuA
MFIQTEETPNPESLKFIPGCTVVESADIVSFNNIEEASNSALATELFKTGYVNSVFLGHDFITITKDSNYDWQIIKPDLLVIIMDYFITGEAVAILDRHDTFVEEEEYAEEDKEIVKEIKELIDARVRPAVAQDGGDIIFKSYKNGIVYVHLRGACSGCPSSTVTLKEGIEKLLQHYIPEIEAVEAL